MLDKLIKLNSSLKRLKRDTTWNLRVDDSFFRNAKGSRILVYHGICRDDHLRFNTLFIKKKTFEAHLKFYKKYFNVISLDDFYCQRFDNNRFNVCLTFDDGFANNYKYVLPLLEQYEVPATFFITGIRDTGYDILWNDVLSIARKYGPAKFHFRNEEFTKERDGRYISSLSNKLLVDMLRSRNFEEKEEMINALGEFRNRVDSDYWLQLTKEEIRDLSVSKWVTIGSHSYYHNDLAKISPTSAQDDICRSKQFLEDIAGREIKAIAFPYGSYT